MANNLSDTSFLLQNLMDHITDNIYFKDTESRFIMVNKAYCDWTGVSAEQVIGKTDFDLFASAHAQQAFDDEQRIINSGEPVLGIEEKETWEDGRITWVSTTKMPLKDADGKITGTFGISRDITEHKEAELRAAYFSEQVRRIKEEMEEDVRMAAELQKTFFPRSYPVYPVGTATDQQCVEFFHHYHASGMVSGDFCTIIPLSPTQVGLFLCDVMGHGVRAALVTALICALLEETSVIENDPSRFLARLNKMLIPILRQQDMFLYATACYMVYDTDTGRLRYANAGHPIPICVSANGNCANWLMDDDALRGPALAIMEDIEFTTLEKQLTPGDSVLMYTDGLYEVLNENDQEFGEQALLQTASHFAESALPEMIPAIIRDASKFSPEGEFDDDICMIALKCRSLPEIER